MAEQPDGVGPQQQLVATTEEVINCCPRLRVLVIGKSGIGKSTLINRAFGIDEAREQDNQRGMADIEKELVSPLNDRFVLHDSKGFEAADGNNYETVKGFITSRNKCQNVGDKLHAIWLCFEIPLEERGDRLLEKGMEEFLKNKKKILGDVPLVFVFTKYDRLVDCLERKPFWTFSKQRLAKQYLQKHCIDPIAKLMEDKHFPYVVVTKRAGYEDRHEHLMQLTSGMIEKKFGFEVTVVTNMAQRMMNPPKVETLIQVGKKRYWNALVSSTDFNGRSIAECLNVIHTDIVNVWNFSDSGEHLKSGKFRGLMVEMAQDDAFSPTAAEPASAKDGSLPLFPTAAPIVAAVALVDWLRSCYRRVPGIQQRFIAYIVDLTHVMTILFNLTANDRGKTLTRRTIQIAFSGYFRSGLRREVHDRISGFHGALISGQALVLQKIDHLLKESKFEPCLSPQPLGGDELDKDEQWGNPSA